MLPLKHPFTSLIVGPTSNGLMGLLHEIVDNQQHGLLTVEVVHVRKSFAKVDVGVFAK